MTNEYQQQDMYSLQKEEEKDSFELGSEEPEAPLPLTVTSRVLYMLGDITAGPAYRFAQWLELVRKRSSNYRSSGFPHRIPRAHSMPLSLSTTLRVGFRQCNSLLQI
uniref:Dual specificity protein phosphatase PHS1-like n=1 Tax=Nicotiana tabacum TaxID=4097 RepID=A0A1S3X8M1_TOBAC|nr:PREDICTED: dual specificity protein phosphatase PHS1-like [Nicotiana tabacum]